MGFGKQVKVKVSEIKEVQENTGKARNKRINTLIRRFCEKTYIGYKEGNGEVRKKMRDDCWKRVIAPYVKSKTSIDLMAIQNNNAINSDGYYLYSPIYYISNNTEKYEKVAKCITDLCNREKVIYLDICNEYGGISPLNKDELKQKAEIENITMAVEKQVNELKSEIEKCYTIIRMFNLRTYEWCGYRFLLVLIERLKDAITEEEYYNANVDCTSWDEKYNYTWELFERELLYRQGIDLSTRVKERGHGDITTYIDENELPFVASVVVGMLERRNINCNKMIEHAKNNDYPNDISGLDYIYRH